MQAHPIRVQVMHEDPLVAMGLVAALREQPDMEVHVRGEGSAHGFDVVIAGHRGALEWLARRKTDARPGHPSRVMVVTAHEREHDVRAALEAGVHGYQLLGCRTDELVQCVRVVARGTPFLCALVAQRIAESLTHEALTAREADVLRLVARGHCNKTIASELDIAVGTVKAHVKAILGKLNARTRTHAAAVASERGLVSLPSGDRYMAGSR